MCIACCHSRTIGCSQIALNSFKLSREYMKDIANYFKGKGHCALKLYGVSTNKCCQTWDILHFEEKLQLTMSFRHTVHILNLNDHEDIKAFLVCCKFATMKQT